MPRPRPVSSSTVLQKTQPFRNGITNSLFLSNMGQKVEGREWERVAGGSAKALQKQTTAIQNVRVNHSINCRCPHEMDEKTDAFVGLCQEWSLNLTQIGVCLLPSTSKYRFIFVYKTLEERLLKQIAQIFHPSSSLHSSSSNSFEWRLLLKR